MQHLLKVNKTAHIYSHGVLNENTQSVWIVLHGYGQLAKFFIRKFYHLPETHFIIAPEALSRFYVQGFSGRVGANWMTKEDRLTDISDYLNYLDNVYAYFLKDVPTGCQINVLGFSQGGATASRWVAHTSYRVDSLILWSCVFPEDLVFPDLKSKRLNCYLLYGNDDEFGVCEQVKKITPLLMANDVPCEIIPFDGKHDIPKNVLLDFIDGYLL